MVHRRSWSIFAVTLASTLGVRAAPRPSGTAPVRAQLACEAAAPAGSPLAEATTTPAPPLLQQPFPTLPPSAVPPADPVLPPPRSAATAGATITSGVQICTAGDPCRFLPDADAQARSHALQTETEEPEEAMPRRHAALGFLLISTLLVLACGPLAQLSRQEQHTAASCAEPGRPDIIFCEDYEDPNWHTKWDLNLSGDVTYERSTDASKVFHGQASLRISTRPGGHAYQHRLAAIDVPADVPIYYRWYHLIEDGDYFTARDNLSIKGNALYGDGFSLRAVARAVDGIQQYSYNKTDAPFRLYEADTPTDYQPNQWTCIELMLKPNTVGQADGEMRMWVNDALVDEQTGIIHRTNEAQQIREVHNVDAWIHAARPGSVVKWEDNLMVALGRIGCADTQPDLARGEPVTLSMPKDAAQRKLVQYGLAANGRPYSQGGHHPRDPVGADGKPLPRIGPESWDCSGLVYAAYQTIGVTVGWVASQQQQDGWPIPCTLADLAGKATRCWQPGDLAFLDYGGAAGADHVSMYIGDGLFADCLNWNDGCKVWVPTGYYYQNFFAGARRILP